MAGMTTVTPTICMMRLLDEVAAERIPSIRRRLMFETERLLLADVPFIPLYTYVTKRMVNPRLKGWQSNVMDHHYSKDMYFLKAATEEATLPFEEAEVIDTATEAAAVVAAPDETTITEPVSDTLESLETKTDNETTPEETRE